MHTVYRLPRLLAIVSRLSPVFPIRIEEIARDCDMPPHQVASDLELLERSAFGIARNGRRIRLERPAYRRLIGLWESASRERRGR